MTTYRDLLSAVATRQCANKKATRGIVEAFVAKLAEAVWREGRVSVPGLGTFTVRHRKARRILDNAGAAMTLPARRVVCVRVAKEWRTRG